MMMNKLIHLADPTFKVKVPDPLPSDDVRFDLQLETPRLTKGVHTPAFTCRSVFSHYVEVSGFFVSDL